MSEPQYTPGRFVWRELLTRDVPRARAFYSELFGWSSEDMDMGPMGTYTLFSKGEKQVAGLMAMPADFQAPPFWTSYASLKDVDAAAAKAKELGGQIYVEPMDVPGIGRFATIADPDGAVLGLYRSANGDQQLETPKTGEFCWETLSSKDASKAAAFYAQVVGWQANNTFGMSTLGVGTGSENQVADIQQAQNFPPSWATYVVVDKLETTRDRAVILGATILAPLIEVPHVGRIAFIQDPAGAAIGLFEDTPR